MVDGAYHVLAAPDADRGSRMSESVPRRKTGPVT